MQLTHATWGQQLRRHYRFMLLFALLLALASASWRSGSVKADSSVENGTVPPGGTIPPGTVPPLETGQIRVIHLAPFDPDVANTAVDICTEANLPVTGFTNLVYLTETGLQTFAAGNYDWKVSKPGCGATIVDIAPFTLFAGGRLTLQIIGDGTNQPISTVLIVEDLGLTHIYYLTIVKNES